MKKTVVTVSSYLSKYLEEHQTNENRNTQEVLQNLDIANIPLETFFKKFGVMSIEKMIGFVNNPNNAAKLGEFGFHNNPSNRIKTRRKIKPTGEINTLPDSKYID